MEQRQAPHDDVAELDPQQGPRGHLGVAGEPAVREFGALGLAGGAGRMQDHRGVGVVALDGALLRRQIVGQRSQPGVVDQPQPVLGASAAARASSANSGVANNAAAPVLLR